MIFPLATKSAYGLDSSESEESVHNCYIEMNESDSETEVSIRFREGIKKIGDIIPFDDDGYISAKAGSSGKDFVVLTQKGIRVFDMLSGKLTMEVAFDEPLWAPEFEIDESIFQHFGDIQEVSDGRYVVANIGALRYVGAAGVEKYSELFLRQARAVVQLRGYTIVATDGKLRISDFLEPRVFRALSFIDIDANITAMTTYNDELWVFHTGGIQVYTLSGGTTVAVAPIVGAHYEYETLVPSPVVHEESMYFLDAHANIYRVDGYSFKKISPPGIKRMISFEGKVGHERLVRHPKLYIERVEGRNFSSLGVVFGAGAQVVAMNVDNGLWRTESFNGDGWEDYTQNKAPGQRSVVYCINNYLLMKNGIYRRDAHYTNDEGQPIIYQLRSPEFHRERELRHVKFIGFNFGYSSYRKLLTPAIAKMQVYKAGRGAVITREFTINQLESQRNRQYNLGSSRTMSISIEINGGNHGIPIGSLVLSGAEIQ